jgi:hypothetical protein
LNPTIAGLSEFVVRLSRPRLLVCPVIIYVYQRRYNFSFLIYKWEFPHQKSGLSVSPALSKRKRFFQGKVFTTSTVQLSRMWTKKKEF